MAAFQKQFPDQTVSTHTHICSKQQHTVLLSLFFKYVYCTQ